MAGAVGSYFGLGTAYMNAAITIDDEMVAYLAEASGSVPAVDVGNGVVATLDGGATMDDDLGNLSHNVERIPLIKHKRRIVKPAKQMSKQTRHNRSKNVEGR